MIFFAAVMAAISVRADYSVTQWHAAAPMKVSAPFMNDSVNSAGEKYALTSLLDNPIRAKVSGKVVEADTAGVVTLTPEVGTMQVIQTQLRSARFA